MSASPLPLSSPPSPSLSPSPLAGPVPAADLQLLGQPRWRNADGHVHVLSDLSAVLLARLALDGPQSGKVLAGQLWPDKSSQRAGGDLRKHIQRLREKCRHPVLMANDLLSLHPSVQADALQLTQQPLQRLLDGEFLGGHDYGSLDFVQEWVAQRRESLRAQRADTLAGHAEVLEKREELVSALRLATRVVELLPQQEHAWRRVMRLHYLRGDHTAAIDAFERFEALLREATGARPGPETLRLLATIERGSQREGPPLKVVPSSLIRPPLRVGRPDQWQAMARAWSAQRAFLLLGDAGMGKSRLLGDFVQPLPGVVTERARPGDARAPYELLTRVLRAILALPQMASALAAPLASQRQELARLLPEWGPAPQVSAVEQRLRDAVESLLVQALGQGLSTLAVDDLHFADLASLEMLRWLSASRALATLRFGFAARLLDDSPAAGLMRSWLDDSQRPERIELPLLSAQDLADLLGSLDLAEFAGTDLAARLHTHAGGQPLFTLETLKDAWLHQRDLQASGALPAPQTVQTLIERRLRELPAEAMDLVRLAAIAGEDFSVDLAAALLERGVLQMAAAWDQLEKANIMNGLRFAHDLMQDCALAMVPQTLRRALHAMVGERLAASPAARPARVAEHWQAAQRWAEAGNGWFRAAAAARLAGRLQEQLGLLERAAACHRQAGDREAEFNAVHASFGSLMLRNGGAAVLAGLPRLEALVSAELSRLKCHLIKIEALLIQEQGAQALELATEAVLLAQRYPLLAGDALCLQGMALAQLDRENEALVVGRQAVEAAHAASQEAQELRAIRALAYVLYKAGRLREALDVQQRSCALAQALGDETEGAAAQAALAGLCAPVGEVAASLAHARLAHQAFTAMGLAHNSNSGALNLISLGRAAAFLGHFDEALQALLAARAMAGDATSVGAQARARVALASLYVSLGQPERALVEAQQLPAGTPPGMRMQAALALARAEQMQGGTGQASWARLAQLAVDHPDPPIVMSAWVEWSYQGDAAAAVAKLRQVRAAFEAIGLLGTCRTLMLRQTARLCDIESAQTLAEAKTLADRLRPHVGVGTCASMYPVEAWLVLARAYELNGCVDATQACLRDALTWLQGRALPQLAACMRGDFLVRNASNRELLRRLQLSADACSPEVPEDGLDAAAPNTPNTPWVK